jgi:hypothetical protein
MLRTTRKTGLDLLCGAPKDVGMSYSGWKNTQENNMSKRYAKAVKRMEAIEEMLVGMQKKVGDNDALSVLGMLLTEMKDLNDRLMIVEGEVGPSESFIETDGGPSPISPRKE